jgi:predicted metal-binding membrane protein
MEVRIPPGSGDRDGAPRTAAGLERLLVLGCLALVAALGGAHALTSQEDVAVRWSAAHGWLFFWMWAAMMAAIMTPSAAPQLRAYARRNRGGKAPAGRSPLAFLAGHLALWTGLSAAAATAHWGLHVAGLLMPGVAIANPVAGGILLMSAGALQLTPFKAACLAGRGAPARFGPEQERAGAVRAFVTGLRHALHGFGRCWPLMAPLFVGGVMSPLWIVVLTPIAMAEKILPYGASIANGVALGAIGWGLWMLAGTLA